MRLDDVLTSLQRVSENVGYLRFSNFYAHQNLSQGEIVQRVARVVVGLFVMLCAYDFVSHSLSFTIRWIVHGTLFLVISCLVLSLLLKRIQRLIAAPAASSEIKPDEAKETSPEIHRVYPPTPPLTPLNRGNSPNPNLSRVKRSLLSEFEKQDQGT